MDKADVSVRIHFTPGVLYYLFPYRGCPQLFPQTGEGKILPSGDASGQNPVVFRKFL
jgi:hypothetical protein